MATQKNGSRDLGRFNIRFDEDTGIFLRKKAHSHRTKDSEYLRQLVFKGLLAESAEAIEQRLSAFLERIEKLAIPDNQPKMPDHVLQSIYTCEALLTAIVEARDPQQLYEAQERAKARIKRERGE